MNAHEIEKAVHGLPHIEALAVDLAHAQSDARCGQWPRPAITAEAQEIYDQALRAYRTAVAEATAELQTVVHSINSALAVPEVAEVE